MAQKIDASTWTGLTADFGAGDVRDAQNPLPGGPKDLVPVSYRERPINWANLIFLVPMWAAIVITSDQGPLDALWFAIAIAAMFIIASLLMQFWRSRPGRKPTITLDAEGLYMPYQYKDPIPWSKIGRIEPSYGNWIRWTSVFFDRKHEVITLAPWPLSLLPEEKRKSSMPMVLISSWNIGADMDEIIRELERFRDNYCGA